MLLQPGQEDGKECLSGVCLAARDQTGAHWGLSVDDGVPYAYLKQIGTLCGRHGLAEEIALSFGTRLGLKIGPLFLRFDALSNPRDA